MRKKRSRTTKERDDFLPTHQGPGFEKSWKKVPLGLESLIHHKGGRLFVSAFMSGSSDS